jgi:uncharacterized delta-60 repeat protein
MTHDLSVVRLHPDGTIDQSFGVDGIAQVRLPGTSATIGSLIVAPDGGIIVSTGSATTVYGNFNGQLDFYRFDASGSMDPAFGDGGHVTFPVGDTYAPSELRQSVSDSQGRIYSLVPGAPTSILRLTTAGASDTAFGPGGKHQVSDLPSFATGPFGSQPPTLASLAMASGDRLLLGAEAPDRLLIGRRLPDGSADPTFGTSGWATASTLVSKPAAAAGLELPDGRVIASAGSNDHPCAAVVRFTGDADGTSTAGAVNGQPCADTCKPVHGCPVVQRKLTISVRNRGPGRTISGRLTAAPTGCAPYVRLEEELPGADHLLRADKTLTKVGKRSYRYAFRVGRSFQAKRVYTRVPTSLDPAAGTCLGTRSPHLRLQKPRQAA